MPTSRFVVTAGERSHCLHIARTGGFLSHFFHFILDFTWPVHAWLLRSGFREEDLTAVHTLDHRAVHFAGLFQEIFGVRPRSGRLDRAILGYANPRSRVHLRGFNPRLHDHLKTFGTPADARAALGRFRDHLARRFSPIGAPGKSVILIERESGDADRGAARRALTNHGALKGAVADFCDRRGIEFNNVQLSGLSFAEQFRLFSRNGVVIGQHGAGLTHALWLTPGESSVIELAGDEEKNHFAHLCADFAVDHRRLLCRAEPAPDSREVLTVDVPGVLDTVTAKVDALSGF